MTPSRAKRKRFAAVIGPCVLGLLLVPLAPHRAGASPRGDIGAEARPAAVNLRLNQGAATRVMAELSGSAQESDTEKPKPMGEDPAATQPPAQAAAVKKEAPPPDKFGFVKEWPFWVIVGGVVIASIGGYMLLRNSNQKAPCSADFNAGCYP